VLLWCVLMLLPVLGMGFWYWNASNNPQFPVAHQTPTAPNPRLEAPKPPELLRTFVGPEAPILSVAFDEAGKQLVAVSEDGMIWRWRSETSAATSSFAGPKPGIETAALSFDGRYVLHACAGDPFQATPGTFHLWDTATGKEVRSFPGHERPVRCLAFAEYGRFAIAGDVDGSVRVWDTETGKERTGKEKQALPRHKAEVLSVALSPKGQWAVSGGADRCLHSCPVIDRWADRDFILERDAPISAVALSHGNLPYQVIFGGGSTFGIGDCSLYQWAHPYEFASRRLAGHTSTVWAVAYAPFSSRALSGDADGRLYLWDLVNDREVGHSSGHTAAITNVRFAPDGRTALSGSRDRTVRLWQMPE
jgi:WD40 repeat protein